jgi:hypothetical protein
MGMLNDISDDLVSSILEIIKNNENNVNSYVLEPAISFIASKCYRYFVFLSILLLLILTLLLITVYKLYKN